MICRGTSSVVTQRGGRVVPGERTKKRELRNPKSDHDEGRVFQDSMSVHAQNEAWRSDEMVPSCHRAACLL